jgi:hypothetical protein
LHIRHTDINVDLLLGKQRVFNIGLDATQEERTENLMKLLYNSVRFGISFL